MEATEFGLFLKSLREKSGFSMGKLAKEAGISQPYISQIESGQRGIPSADILNKLAGPLGVSSTELMIKAGHVSEDDIAKSASTSSFLDEMIHEYVHLLLSDRDHPFFNEIENEFTSRIGEIYRNYDLETNSKITEVEDSRIREDIPEHYSDLLLKVENTKFKEEVLRELRFIVLEFHLKFNPAYSEAFRSIDELAYYLNRPEIRYRGRTLTPGDRQRILEMLKLMFPENN